MERFVLVMSLMGVVQALQLRVEACTYVNRRESLLVFPFFPDSLWRMQLRVAGTVAVWQHQQRQ
jgi:hypothetical protein